MKVTIKYCSMWGYEPKAVSLTSTLLTNFKQRIKTLELIPSGGGCFEVTVNGKLVYSKLETGTFPEEQWVVDTLEAQANK